MQNRYARTLSLVGVSFLALTVGCFFGGGGGSTPSITRPGSIPTATLPPSLPEPIALGESQPAGPQTAVTGETTYVVKSGDTLLAIASQLGVPVAQQATWVADVLRLNGMQDATLLKAGQELRLPKAQPTPRSTGTVLATGTVQPTTAPRPTVGLPGATTVPPTSAPAASPTPRPTVVSGGGGTYTVVSGDFPLQIAAKLGVPESQQTAWAEQLVTLNNISATGLQVGQVLQLPPIPSGGATPTRTP